MCSAAGFAKQWGACRSLPSCYGEDPSHEALGSRGRRVGASSALALANGGVVDSMLSNPADPQLAGIVLLQQLVLLAVDARFAFVETPAATRCPSRSGRPRSASTSTRDVGAAAEPGESHGSAQGPR